MDLVLRAYDHETVLRAESLPVERLWTLLGSGGIRDAAKAGVGLTVQPDVFARETVVSRLEALIQEGYGPESLARLRGAEPTDLATLRRHNWPAITAEEAVALREDLVRYLTYGLWRAPELTIARALAVLTGRDDAAFLLGSAEATAALHDVLDAVADDDAFAARYSAAVRASLPRTDEATLRQELARLQQLLGPANRLMRDVHRFALRVIAYQDDQGGDGLTRFLTEEPPEAVESRQPPPHPNGHDPR